MLDREIFLDIDTQRDFMLPDGALYVEGAEGLIPQIERLTRFAVEHDIIIVSSFDAHEPNDPEFKEFPPHCVKGTPGQENIPESLCANRIVVGIDTEEPPELVSASQIIIEKQTLNFFDNPRTHEVLDLLEPDKIYIYSVATDYCIKIVALEALAHGYNIAIIKDAIMGIEKEAAQKALAEIQHLGGKLINTEDILSE